METAKIAVDSCYVLRQFLTPLPSIDFREIRGLIRGHHFPSCQLQSLGKNVPQNGNFHAKLLCTQIFTSFGQLGRELHRLEYLVLCVIRLE